MIFKLLLKWTERAIYTTEEKHTIMLSSKTHIHRTHSMTNNSLHENVPKKTKHIQYAQFACNYQTHGSNCFSFRSIVSLFTDLFGKFIGREFTFYLDYIKHNRVTVVHYANGKCHYWLWHMYILCALSLLILLHIRISVTYAVVRAPYLFRVFFGAVRHSVYARCTLARKYTHKVWLRLVSENMTYFSLENYVNK